MSQTLYEHVVNEKDNRLAEIKAKLELGDYCADEIKVNQRLIALACISKHQIAFVDRQSMELLEFKITWPSTETLTNVNDFLSNFDASEPHLLEYESNLMIV